MILHSLFVAIGGCFGAITRFQISQWLNQPSQSRIPWGTLTVNLCGAFLLGLILGLKLPTPWTLLLGTGFLGAFTTFSTLSIETIQFYMDKKWKPLIRYLGISYGFGLLLAFFGLYIAAIIS